MGCVCVCMRACMSAYLRAVIVVCVCVRERAFVPHVIPVNFSHT